MSLRRATSSFLRIFRHPCQTFSSTFSRTSSNSQYNAGKLRFSCQYGYGDNTWRRQDEELVLWAFLCGQAGLILGINVNGLGSVLAEDVSSESSSENGTDGASITGLRRIEDGSVVSNIHTSKWRVFTDAGRDRFLQGKLVEAEKLFLAALQEAREGFGERDAHVASACNNLAELYRVRKAFDKAEPLYLEAIQILEESFGSEDIRVGAALHNLGQFYFVQRKLEEAHVCYERALKIKRRVLGDNHIDYADTMYHLGRVLYLQGKEKDSEALILDSIKILEDGGLRESVICIKRLRHLAQMYIKSNRLAEAENIQRKILHNMELAKGWSSLDTVVSAEEFALTLQSEGSLTEAQELLEKCLEARKSLLSDDHIQIAANILHIARVKLLISNRLRKIDISEAIAELDKAKSLLESSTRIARHVLHKLTTPEGKKQYQGVSRETGKDGNTAAIILLQSLNTLALIEITKQELQESVEQPGTHEAENVLRQCISDFKEFGIERSISNSPIVKAEYLSCLKHLMSLISETRNGSTQEPRRPTLQELKDEIKRVELELSPKGKRRN